MQVDSSLNMLPGIPDDDRLSPPEDYFPMANPPARQHSQQQQAATASVPLLRSESSSFSGGGDDDTEVTRHDIDLALGAIAAEDKRALLYALEHAPELIQLETHPVKFLREDFDVAKAISRLALYWKYRVQFFGEERAFRPMTLSEDGALSSEDVAAFSTGVMFPIQQGPVPSVFMEKDLIYLQLPEIRRRIYFYMMQTMSEVRRDLGSMLRWIAWIYHYQFFNL